jgi:hypothetical protein
MSETNGKATKATVSIHATAEAARASKPASQPRWKLWKVSGKQDGQTWFCYARSRDAAMTAVALSIGLTAVSMDRKAATPEAVDGLLASLSDGDRQALLAKYGVGTPASTPVPAAKGNKGGK